MGGDVDFKDYEVGEIKAATHRKPGVVVAAASYLSEKNLQDLRKKRQPCLVAVRGWKRTKWPRGSETQGDRPFAEIEQTMRFRRFATRGRANFRGEWGLVCAAANTL